MTKKIRVPVNITPAAADRLTDLAERTGLGRSGVVELLLRGTPLAEIEASAPAASVTVDHDHDGQGERV